MYSNLKLLLGLIHKEQEVELEQFKQSVIILQRLHVRFV